MGSDRVRAEVKSSSTLTPGFKPKQFSFLQPRYQDRVESETDSLTQDKQQNTWSPSNPTPLFLGHSFGRVSVLPIQAKLTIGQPGDKYEKEADRVADQVMRMPEPKIQRVCPKCEEELQRQPMEEEEEEEETLQTKPLAKQITPLVQKQAELIEEEEEKTLQTKTTSGQPPNVSSSLQNRIKALQGGGQPLPQSERAFFEPRFGTDFSQVRVHADSRAAETAHGVNARAFTLGNDIVFGAGKYQPRAFEGQRLLAHELTHVVQQQTPGQVHRGRIQRETGELVGNDALLPTSGPITLPPEFRPDFSNIKIWIKAFIPRDIPHLTRTVPDGPHKGKTMIPGPTFINDCFLTDNRTWSSSESAKARMTSMVV